jgi:hypothetical protein
LWNCMWKIVFWNGYNWKQTYISFISNWHNSTTPLLLTKQNAHTLRIDQRGGYHSPGYILFVYHLCTVQFLCTMVTAILYFWSTQETI